MSAQRSLTKLEQDIVDKVRRFGCMVMHVFDAKGEEPSFSYSIGFPENTKQPDVVIFGLRKELMHSMINEIFRQIREEELQLNDQLVISGLLEGFDCVAKEVSDDSIIRDHLGSAIWYERTLNNREVVRCFQIVWPGAYQGLFPWDEGCDPDVVELQPPLYLMESAQ